MGDRLTAKDRFWPKPAVRTSLACCQSELVAIFADRPHTTQSGP